MPNNEIQAEMPHNEKEAKKPHNEGIDSQIVGFEYFYGKQSSRYAFYRIPKLMFMEKRFDALSTDAKLLYGMMVDRMELSQKNGWVDGQGRVYIYFTVDEVKDRLRCANDKAVRLLMRKDSELARQEHIKASHLENIPLLTSRQTMVRGKLSGWSGRDFDKLNIVATYNLIFNASLMVAEGFGYALCLDKLVNTSESSELCFRPLEPRLDAHLDIVWKKYQVLSKAAEMFLKCLQEELRI